MTTIIWMALLAILAFWWGYAAGVLHARKDHPLEGEDGALPASCLRSLIVHGQPIRHDDRFAVEGRWPGGVPRVH